MRGAARHAPNVSKSPISEQRRFRINAELHAAIARSDVDAVRRCLDDGADINKAMRSNILHAPFNGRTICKPIDIVLKMRELGSVDVLRLLIDRGVELDLDEALIHAIPRPHLAIFLVRRGAQVNSTRHDGFSALMIAVCNQCGTKPGIMRDALVGLLLDRGAAVDYKTSSGRTALFLACEHGNLVSVKLLLARGATVDSRSNYAVQRPSYSKMATIKALFDAAAPPSKRLRVHWGLRIRLHVAGPRGGDHSDSARHEAFGCRTQISRAIARRVISFLQ